MAHKPVFKFPTVMAHRADENPHVRSAGAHSEGDAHVRSAGAHSRGEAEAHGTTHRPLGGDPRYPKKRKRQMSDSEGESHVRSAGAHSRGEAESHKRQMCNNPTSIELPDTLTSIDASAFGSSSDLTSLTLPESLTSVGPRAFFGAKGLTALSLPNSLTTIGEGAFRNCTGLTTLTPVFAVFVCICLPLLHVFITLICCVML